jgi:hypothetical protein
MPTRRRRRRMRGGAELPGSATAVKDAVQGAVAGFANQTGQGAYVAPVTDPPTGQGAAETIKQDGGRRRRRGSRRTRMATKRHRKGSKKRTAGKWINHVKKYAKDNKVSFKDAMSSSECKRSYKRM